MLEEVRGGREEKEKIEQRETRRGMREGRERGGKALLEMMLGNIVTVECEGCGVKMYSEYGEEKAMKVQSAKICYNIKANPSLIHRGHDKEKKTRRWGAKGGFLCW